jgi:isoleucyl-tRNA synthetase
VIKKVNYGTKNMAKGPAMSKNEAIKSIEGGIEVFEEEFSAKGGSASGGEGNSPHRPWVDNVKIKCSKCGKPVSRIKDVGNPWLDAGIVSFSTFIDPKTKKVSYLTDKKYWKEWFPAELICESFPGQFKNWFYSLIVMSTVLEDTNPAETVFGYATVHDENDEEMHKSKGNAIWFDDAVEKIGADPMRWMYSRQNPVDNLRFGYHNAAEIKRKLLTLYNVFAFFNTYVEKKDIKGEKLPAKLNNVLDAWIISRLSSLVFKTTKDLNEYNPMGAVLAIENFFVDDLSLWYVRRSRKRFHRDGEDRKEAVQALYYVLLNLTKLIAPIMPFSAEEMYQGLKTEEMPESVHLCDWPKAEEKRLSKELEEKMSGIRNIVTLALAERAAAGIKVRQPLRELKIKNVEFKKEKDLLELVKEEVNVKEIIFDNKIKKEVELDAKITKELGEEGEVREIVRNARDLRKKLGLSPQYIVSGLSSTATVLLISEEELLKEIGAKSFKKVESVEEMDVDVKKEIKLDGKKHYIGIKK